MPQFKTREEYEKWKAERMGGQRENPQPEIQRDKPLKPEKPLMPQTVQTPQTPETPETPQTPRIPRASQTPRTPHIPRAPFPEPKPPSSGNGLRPLGELFHDTWGLFKTRFVTLICLYLLSVVLMIVAAGVFAGGSFLLGSMLPVSKNVLNVGIILVGIVTGSIAMSWGLAAFTSAAVDDTIGIKEALGRGWPKIMSFISVSSLFAFIVCGGFFLFLVPGVIFLIWFLFSQFVVVAENERGMKALLKSKEYVRNEWFEVFIRAFIIWLISVGLGFIPMVGPILSILFVPFMIIFIKLVYEDLRDSKGKLALHPYSLGTRFKWIGAGALGYVVFPLVLFVTMGATLTVPLLMLKGMLSDSKIQFKSTENQGGAPFRIGSKPHQQSRAEDSESQLPSGASPFSEAKKPEATGEALIIRDGASETFLLQTGFFSETRMANPRKASIQFQIPAEKHSNARRIEMILDATKTGEHSIDGNFMRDTFMGRSSEQSEQDHKPRFQYVADGGQVFFPKDSCTVVVTSPYTGTADSIFAGEVKNCVVTSAGISHTISAEFKMIGAPSR